MPPAITSVCISTAVALAGGVLLGYLADARRWTAELPLWVWAVIPAVGLTALRYPPGVTAAGAFCGMPIVAIFAARGFQATRACSDAARSLGSPEWRVLWRVMLPNAWRWVLGGALVALLRVSMERALAGNL
jgi:ABC-type sulfate transport system permease component